MKDKAMFHKSTFEKTSEDRRQKVFDVAVAEFAQNGYSATNINVIAKKSGVSIGAMYSYFASKEDLFLTIVGKGLHILEVALQEIEINNKDIFEVFEQLLLAARKYTKDFPQYNQIYLDLSTQGLSSLSSRLSGQLESVTAAMYQNVIKRAKENGLIYKEADERMLSFCLDNLLILFQFSFTSDYYKERMKIFLGEDALKDEDGIIKGIMAFVRRALSA